MKQTTTKREKLTAFQRGYFPPEAATVEYWIAKGLVGDEARYAAEHINDGTTWLNNVYQVTVYDDPMAIDPDFPPAFHLSIKRRDKKTIRDWRDLQEIKNMLIGPEHEAVELFPAESRRVDTANQYHLFVLKDPTVRFPFGFFERKVTTQDEQADLLNVKQRPL